MVLSNTDLDEKPNKFKLRLAKKNIRTLNMTTILSNV